ncbi:SNF2 family N-terminal domain-containing protein [Trichoderma chlorosporum]
MEPHDLTQFLPNLHNSVAAKRYLDPDDFETSSHVAFKRACLQPQNPLTGASMFSSELQTYDVDPIFDADDPNFSIEMFEGADMPHFEDQMDTSGNEEAYPIEEDISSTSPKSCDIKTTCLTTEFAETDQLEPDMCFGVIVATAASSFEGPKGAAQVPVTLSASDAKIMLYCQDTQKYAGIIKDAALTKILREFTIRADAALIISTQLKKKTSKKSSMNIRSPITCFVRIVLYGIASDKNAVGIILGDAGLYFQHPSPSEYDSSMQYCNPHYLLRPGSRMPTLEDDSGARYSRHVESDKLNESNKGRFMKLFDEASDNNLKANIEQSGRLRSKLKEHQIAALAWLTEIEARCIRDGSQSLWEPIIAATPTKEYRHKITGNRRANPELAPGGVLADEMGLGKSLSILALICSSLDIMETQQTESKSTQPRQSRTTLIVTPKSTIHSWQQQCESHIHPGRIAIIIYIGSGRQKLQDSLQKTDIVLTTYETMRRDWEEKGPLFTARWCRVVLDEAHHIRTRNSQTFKAACEIQACYRWCLTGTPIHNSLDDFAALLSFVGVPIFMKKSFFDFWITKPIKKKSLFALQRLGLLIKGTCLRRTKKHIELSDSLPDRREQITWVKLSPEYRDLYSFFEREAANIASGAYRYNHEPTMPDDRKNNNILKFINFLRLICDHGEQLLPQSAIEVWRTTGDKFIDWQKFQEPQATCDRCGLKIDNSQAQPNIDLDMSYPEVVCKQCRTGTEENWREDESTYTAGFMSTPNDEERSYSASEIRPIQQSPKLKALIDNLRQEQYCSNQSFFNQPIKSVVFSSWIRMIDLTQQCLEANKFVCSRIDGQLSLEGRMKAIKQFNLDPKCTVMLATIGSASEGVDFTAANNVHLLEPHWNPMVEAQAFDRVHRIGQQREVVVTRYLVKDTIETYVQWTQKEKLKLIQQSLDSQDISQIAINDRRWKELRACLKCEISS